jgi:hypothetical protein
MTPALEALATTFSFRINVLGNVSINVRLGIAAKWFIKLHI